MSEHATITLRSTDLTWRDVDGAIIVLDERSWTYLNVNGSGAVLWPAIAAGATIAELRALLVSRYGIEEDVAARDVDGFVEMLARRELLHT